MPHLKIPSIHLIEDTTHVLKQSDGRNFSPSAYDTAWLARIPDHNNSRQPLFPQCLQWLQHNQHQDGSWGSQVTADYHYDKIICTLAAVISLATWCKAGWPLHDLIERGTCYLNRSIKLLNDSNNRTVGFELLFPALFQEALALGIALQPNEKIHEIQQLRDKKLNKLKQHSIFERPVTLLHSIEGLPSSTINWEKVMQWQDTGGSFLTSPSATAFAYMNTGNEACLKYLKKALGNNSYVPVGDPLDIFEAAWCLKIISKLELRSCFKKEYEHKINFLKTHWSNEKGISWSSVFDLPDLDDTAVVYYLLKNEGEPLQPEVFNNYFTNNNLFCFPNELNSSPTHLLHFLHAYDGSNHELFNSAKRQLNELLNDDWTDKWHLSPFYFTSIAIDSSFQSSSMNQKEIIHFITRHQLEDGGWGMNGSNPEETAWACFTILLYLKNHIPNNEAAKIYQCLQRGIDFLLHHKMSSNHTDMTNLWVEKCLFTPYNIVNTLINGVILRSLQLLND